ncbi:hypothetical protein CLV51_1011205 [Chitinophaga niastensis]|uniref:Uncharacterized protein n=1 Tax=Chitinophaga niastensis TaxID=536980 RepID=A0A2P8HUH6_CHINA|nr:hypothetical protein [Chitinophaga niastensis]PSL49868.1 hypothetical protein CLV51_1011205 [Chitinophaga niastensis]
MQPNNFFALRRWQFYLQKHFTDSFRFYLMALLTVFGLMTAIPIFFILTSSAFGRLSNLAPFYYIGLFFGGLLFTSWSFNELGHKEKGVDFLMLPASKFEKFITIFLVSTIGFFLLYHLSFYTSYKIIDSARVAKYGQHIVNDYSFLDDPKEKIYIYYAYMALQAVFLLGATYYHKYSFIKTVLSLFIFILGLYIINAIFILFLFGNEGDFWKSSMPFVMVNKLEMTAPNSWHPTLYVIPEWLQKSYLFAAKFLIAPTLWTIAYFRLQDKEI